MIQGRVFSIDLMELLFYGFDIIHGIDLLTKHRAKVDYESKQVILSSDYD